MRRVILLIVAMLAGPLPALAQNLRVQGVVTWANGSSALNADQGGAIELGSSQQGGAVPYIDFHYGVGYPQDFNFRVMNYAPGHLIMQGDWVDVSGRMLLGMWGMPGQLWTGDTNNCGNGLPCKLVLSANTDGWFHVVPYPGYFTNGVCIGCGGAVNLLENGNLTVNGGTWLAGGATANGGLGVNNGATINGGATLNGGSTVNGNSVVQNGSLIVIGNAYKTGATHWAAWSDARLKHNIAPLASGLGKLLALRPVSFEWNDPAKYGGGRSHQVGFIAQEVEKVLPEWVGTGPDGYKTIEMAGFESLTVKAVQELAEQNRRLDQRNVRLEERNRKLEERVAALEAGGHPRTVQAEHGALGLAALVGLALVGIPWARRRRTEGRS
jgi:hypothetical protein